MHKPRCLKRWNNLENLRRDVRNFKHCFLHEYTKPTEQEHDLRKA